MAQTIKITSIEDYINFNPLNHEEGTEFDFDIEFEGEDTSDFELNLPEGYHSEVPAQFITAFHRKQQNIYRIVALIKNDSWDARTLTQEQLDLYEYRLEVRKGSSELEDNAKEILTALLKEAVTKMTPDQIFYILGGAILLFGTVWGFKAYLNYRKEIRLEEISSDDKSRALDSIDLGQENTAEAYKKVIDVLERQGPEGRKIAHAADDTNAQMLRAAGLTNAVEIGGIHLSRDEARELRTSSRRKSYTRTVTQDMRVISVNTTDQTYTTVALENPITEDQIKVTFADTMIEGNRVRLVYKALETRSTASFKLRMKLVEEEVQQVEILDVSEAEDPT